jgi:ribulose-5-phosphate 4-epimerase/fuculose-1-phosphate aldolase
MSDIINELDTVALNRDLAEHGLAKGDLGTVVHVYSDGKAYEVEFMTLTGATLGVVTLEAGDIRAIRDGEIAHAREVA